MVFEVGRMAVKISGRDAGETCVVVDVIDDSFVLIDGETRRRRCNVSHLEPLKETLDIKKNASHDSVVTAFKSQGIELKSKKQKEKKAKPKKKNNHKVKEPKKESSKQSKVKPVKKLKPIKKVISKE